MEHIVGESSIFNQTNSLVGIVCYSLFILLSESTLVYLLLYFLIRMTGKLLSCRSFHFSPMVYYKLLNWLKQNKTILKSKLSTSFFFFFVSGFSNHKLICKLHLILSILTVISSLYLAGILVILQDFCVVCASTYVVNALNLVLVNKKMKLLSCTKTKTKKKE